MTGEPFAGRETSPVATPQYNGSCEAAGGSHKKITDDQAALAPHPGRWTSYDLQRARVIRNRLGRPWARGFEPLTFGSGVLRASTTLSPRFPKCFTTRVLRFHHFSTTLQPDVDFVHLWGD